MRVKRLKMEAFRGIGDLTLDFDETEPTVLIGINGVGKSSILDCIAIFMSHITAQIQKSSGTLRFFSNKDVNNNKEETHNEITFITNNLLEIVINTTKVKISDDHKSTLIDKNFFEVGLFIKDMLTKENFKKISDDEYHQLQAKLISIIDSKFSKDPLFDNYTSSIQYAVLSSLQYLTSLQTLVDDLHNKLENISDASIPLFVYYPVNRAVIDMPLESLQTYSLSKQIDAYDQALTGEKIDFKNFFEWFRNREDLENEIRSDNDNSDYRDKQLDAVRKAIDSLIPGFSNLRVRRLPLRMTVQKQGQELIINQLSDGEKCLLAMVGDLARRLAIANPGLSDPLQGSGVVLIDEIELHLHPKWQREIIPALTRTFPNCQFIVTTHSPQVVSHVKPEGIYILEKTENGVIAKRPESSFGRDSNRILEDLMDVPARPQEIKDSLLELFRLIDAGDLTGARELRQRLATEIGADEPDFVKADVLIRRKEIIGR